jgi:hypothetical protein
MTTTTLAPSTADIAGMLTMGLSLREISRKTGFAREKVRQIGMEQGVATTVPSDWLAPVLINFAVDVSEEICSNLDEGRVLTAPELRERFSGVTVKYLRAAVERADCVGLLGVASPPDKVAFSNEAIVQALRDAWAAVGDETVEMTGPTYDRLLDAKTIEGPSRVLIIQRFGSWAAACEDAGIPFRAARRTYDGFGDEDLLSWVDAYAHDAIMANTPVTFAGYSKWAKDSPHDAPSGSLIKARFFGHKPWNDIRDKAILHVYEESKDYFVRKPFVPDEML